MRRIIEILEPRTLLSTYVINGGAGNDVWWQLEARAGQVIVNGQTVDNPAITDVQVNGFDGTDLLVINAASIPIVYNSGPGGTNEDRDRLRVGNGLLSTLVTAPITFNGSFGSSVELRDDSWSGYGNYDFSGGAAVTRRIRWGSGAGSLALDTSYVDVNTSAGGSSINFDPDDWGDVRTTFYGGNGADSLYVNFAELGVESTSFAIVSFLGGGGNDTFQVDDSASTDDDVQDYNIMRNRILQGAAAQVYFDAAVEIVGFVGSQSVPQRYVFREDTGSTHLYVTGGNANDEFVSLDSSWPLAVVSGGGGVDSLYVDDDYLENAVPFRASLEPTLLTRDRGTIFDYYRMNIQFFGIESATYEAAPNTDRFDVYGTSSEIAPGLQWTILCGAGNDNVTVHPHDEAGNLTINGNLGISGGGGPTQSRSTTGDRPLRSPTAFTTSSARARQTSAGSARPGSARAPISRTSSSAPATATTPSASTRSRAARRSPSMPAVATTCSNSCPSPNGSTSTSRTLRRLTSTAARARTGCTSTTTTAPAPGPTGARDSSCARSSSRT
jgi:hypothetical protein